MKKMRIKQFLRMSGLFKTNQEILDTLSRGEINIEDKIITNPNFQFRLNTKKVYWKGKLLAKIEQKVYVLLNKPEGYLSAKLTEKDIKLNKKSIFELIQIGNKMTESLKQSLVCVGRLDEDTSGLIILTNDGQLCSEITLPKSKIQKTYKVHLEKPINPEDAANIEKGITIKMEHNGVWSDYTTKPCKINLNSDRRSLEITISEGKKREIRRIFESFGNRVVSLERIAIGNLKLKELNLRKGQYLFADKEFIKKRLK